MNDSSQVVPLFFKKTWVASKLFYTVKLNSIKQIINELLVHRLLLKIKDLVMKHFPHIVLETVFYVMFIRKKNYSLFQTQVKRWLSLPFIF